MQPNNLQAQFGQQATNFGNQYTEAQQAAQTAATNIGNYQQTMQSGTDMYGQQLQAANANAGYNPGNLQYAQNQVQQLQGILGGLPRAVQAGNANYGATAGDVANQVSTEGANLNQSLNLANTQMGQQQTAAQLGLTGAQQGTTAGLQGQQNQLTALQNTYTAAQQQMASAQSQQQFYSNLYQQQGYLNSEQAANYAAAQASEAQAALDAQNTKLAAANLIHQNQVNSLAAGQSAYSMTPNSSGGENYFHNGAPVTVQQYGAGNNWSPSQISSAAAFGNSAPTAAQSSPSLLNQLNGGHNVSFNPFGFLKAYGL